MDAGDSTSVTTRSLLITLAALIAAACAYFLFSVRSGGAGVAGNGAPPLTVEEKAEVLRSLTQTGSTRSPQASVQSEGEATMTPSEAAARQRTLENAAQSSSDSPAAQQSDAEKAKILESLQSQ